ncbi:MAG: methyltransferase domain-containing protein [Actinobacteria bacterium]|nr:methyltransferase domain-containing protein [Actinomycetota bacterium]MCL5883477.1 methyltransferase domain-containing protein [Actinomycetota bacterium]
MSSDPADTLSSDPADLFRCPRDRGELGRVVQPDTPETAGLELLACSVCGSVYRIREGIPCFVPEDRFYEGKFTAPTQDGVAQRAGPKRKVKAFYDRWSSTTVKHQFTREFLSHYGPGTLILDVGCGGGNEVLAPWRTVGIDLSFAGLRSAGEIYRAVATADATSLPFADGTFDIINSWDVFGHIPFDYKNAVLAEWKRVLKPGGRMLHIIEAHCTAPFYKLVQRDHELFQKYFIELDGHYGLELPSQIEARFEAAGFKVEKNWPFFRAGIFPPEEYSKRLGPEYAAQSKLLKALAAFGHACDRNKQLDRTMSFATGVAARALNPLFPKEWGSTVFIVARG